jgi:hypothetical protein
MAAFFAYFLCSSKESKSRPGQGQSKQTDAKASSMEARKYQTV